ncbi:MAG: SusE domain-containing protein [Bacteroidales bacterium]|nr:SusE domain-containing protein [Bacteroidales bacterium]
MKTLRYLAVLAVSALMASCTLDIERPRIAEADDFVSPVLSEVADIVSDANTSNVEQVTFTWSAADFGASTQVQYSVYAKKGEATALIGQSYSNNLSIAKGDLVGVVVNDLGGVKNENVSIDAYVEAVISGTVGTAKLVSNNISFSVFTYLPAKKNIWLPGKYQGWNQLGTMIWEYAAGTSQYKFLVDVSNPDETPYYFKVVDEGKNWVGMNDGYKPVGWTVADPENGDGNFSVTADEPIIWLTIDTKKKEVYKETVTKVGLIGGFNGWADDEPSFTYNATDNVWESPVISFDGSSGWLVRLNNSWDHKYGSPVASSDIEGGFELVQGGSDIPSPAAGDYVVRLHTNRTPLVIEYVKQ